MVLRDLKVWRGTFFKKITYITAKIRLFLTIGAVNNDIKSKKNFAYNHGHKFLLWGSFPYTVFPMSMVKKYWYVSHDKLRTYANMGRGVMIKSWTFEGRKLYQNWTSSNKGGEGSDFWSFCNNVIIECPLSYKTSNNEFVLKNWWTMLALRALTLPSLIQSCRNFTGWFAR